MHLSATANSWLAVYIAACRKRIASYLYRWVICEPPTKLMKKFDCSNLKSWIVMEMCDTQYRWSLKKIHHTWCLWNAIGYTSIPIAINVADPCGFNSLQNKTIITDIDCPRPCSCSIVADYTTRDGWAVHKSSVCTACCVCCPIVISKICIDTSCVQQKAYT